MKNRGVEVYKGISEERLKEISDNIKNIRIALLGDICLDVYWWADMTKSEISRETPHFPLPIVKEWMSPGAGGNVAANIAALGAESVKVMGVIGRDWRGEALIRKFQELRISTEGIIVSEKAVTNAYCKPIRKGISQVQYEDPRIDFNNYEELPRQDEEKLLEILNKCAADIDVLCVSDQLAYGCITAAVRDRIITLAKKGLTVIVDSRDRIGLYSGVTLKPNEVEGLKEVNKKIDTENLTLEEYSNAAKLLAGQNDSNVCMTLGPKGCVYTDSKRIIHIPSNEVPPPIDICGAGDTFLSAFSCAIAAGAKAYEAASFANLAAEVTIKKIGMTGTASLDEIRERHDQINHL